MDSRSFDRKRIAEGYLKDRPYLHGEVMGLLRKDMGEGIFFENGLDVGCGAGLSTRALKQICGRVTGIDISPEMIRLCRAVYNPDGMENGYRFVCVGAEEIEHKAEEIGHSFDIVTVAGAVNWIEEGAFLRGLSRVMCPGGLLFVYDFWITEKMRGSMSYTRWYQDAYLDKFPRPPRKENIWRQEKLPGCFRIVRQVPYQLSCPFDLDSFVRFMMIQSNVNMRIEQNEIREEDARDWFYVTLSSVWGKGCRELVFEGYGWYVRMSG